METDKPTCETCKFCQVVDFPNRYRGEELTRYLFCRRYPPSIPAPVALRSGGSYARVRHPQVTNITWCGEYVVKPE